MPATDNCVALLRAFDRNPAYTEDYLAVLEFCAQERGEDDVIQLCESYRTSPKHIQSAAAIVATLVRVGGLRQTILVDGAPYEGSFESLQADENIPDDAEVIVTLRTLPEGASAAERVREGRVFAKLVESCPHRVESFKLVLTLCAEEGGKSTREIQSALKEANMLEPDPNNGVDGIHASYFTGMLENSGLLVWNGASWIASDRGIATLVDL